MRTSLLKRGGRALLAGGAAVAVLLAAVPPASAAPTDPISTTLLAGPDGINGTGDDVVIAIAGSDTLESVTTDIAKTFPSGVRANVYNVRPATVAGIAFPGKTVWKGDGTLTDTVPGDAKCATVTYDPGEGVGQLTSDTDSDGRLWPANGSSEGRTALTASAKTTSIFGSAAIDIAKPSPGGCIDVARMSARPGTTEPQWEAYGFAIDLANWGTTSLNAPASLRLQQLRDIFKCQNEVTAGLNATQQAVDADNVVNNWAEVGGLPGPIARMIPQVGSGTRSFFLSNVLGNSDVNISAPNGVAGCPDRTEVQESDGTLLLDPLTAPRYNEYIVGYSFGKWVFQSLNRTNLTKDKRGGVRVGAIERDPAENCADIPDNPLTGAVDPTPLSNENNGPVFPIRYDGAAFSLDNATLICWANIGSVTASAGSLTLTAPANTFHANLIGYTLSGAGINPTTTIVGVNGTGTEATIDVPTSAAIAAGTIQVGLPPVTEKNPNIGTSSAVSVYPGTRMLYHILWGAPNPSPNYAEALALFGHDGTGKSPLCNNKRVSTIASNGFVPLPPIADNGAAAATCRFFTS